jgi:hypothetical protein
MSDYHRLHWVSFYKQSIFSAPVFVSMNCAAFDALSRLNDHDADLCALKRRITQRLVQNVDWVACSANGWLIRIVSVLSD